MTSSAEIQFVAERVIGWLGRQTRDTSTQDIAELGSALSTTTGEVRSDNQDRAVIARYASNVTPDSSFTLLALCDGMGGMVEGARCAEIVIAVTIQHLIQRDGSVPSDALKTAVLDANQVVHKRYKGRGGSTVAAILFTRHHPPVMATVGDSRVYAVTPREKVRQISTDDTVGSEVSRITGIEVDKLALNHLSGQLAQYVGMGDGIEPRLYIADEPSRESAYCLTSDGAHDVGSPVLDRLLVTAPTPFIAVSRVIQVSRWSGGRDNATIIWAPAAISAELTSGNRPTAGMLEVWDSFSKLEIYAEAARNSGNRITSDEDLSAPVVSQSGDADIDPDPKPRTGKKIRVRRGTSKLSEEPRPDALKIEIVEDNPLALQPESTTSTGQEILQDSERENPKSK